MFQLASLLGRRDKGPGARARVALAQWEHALLRQVEEHEAER